jgi:hypothetical protein
VHLGGGDSSLSCGSMSFLKEAIYRRRAAEKAKKGLKHTTTSVTASHVSARNHGHGPSDNIDDILIGVGCTGSGVNKAKDVSESESCGIVPSPTSTGVVVNVPRRDGSVGLINKAKGRGFMEEPRFVHTISAFAVYLGISFFIIGYAHAIHSTVTNVPEGLLLIGRPLTIKHKRLLTTNLDANAGDKMGTLTPNNLVNGPASPVPMFCSVLFCSVLFCPPRPPLTYYATLIIIFSC